MKLRIFTDGACSGNPGPGGWACLFLFPEAAQVMSCGCRATTNNRMELMAVAEALEQYIERYWPDDSATKEIEISSDSAYVVNAVNRLWLDKWIRNGWRGNRGDVIKNRDLWRRFLKAQETLEWLGVKVSVCKVEGHAGNEFNETVDRAARMESEKERALLEEERRGKAG